RAARPARRVARGSRCCSSSRLSEERHADEHAVTFRADETTPVRDGEASALRRFVVEEHRHPELDAEVARERRDALRAERTEGSFAVAHLQLGGMCAD